VTTGFYDTRGRWISTAPEGDQYHDRADRQSPVLSQLAATEGNVRRAVEQRRMSPREGDAALREISNIRSREQRMRHNRRGDLSGRDEAAIQLRVDRLNRRIGFDPS